MSNDWSVIPACAVEFNGDTALETEPHCVVWSFHDKADTAEAEQRNGAARARLQRQPGSGC